MKVFVLLFFSTAALAAPTVRAVDRALAGIEKSVDEATIRDLGPGADEALIRYAEDRATSPLRRMRALAALRWAPSQAAREYLLSVIAVEKSATGGAQVLDVSAAAGALAPYGDEVLADVAALAAHSSADVRQGAAAALRAIDTPAARAIVQARFAVEPDPGVRRVLAAPARR
jgi:hypothetical protein